MSLEQFKAEGVTVIHCLCLSVSLSLSMSLALALSMALSLSPPTNTVHVCEMVHANIITPITFATYMLLSKH